MKRTRVALALMVIGLLLCGFALFAHQLGLDNNPGWGARRYAVLLGGLSLFVLAALFQFKGRIFHRLPAWRPSSLPGWMTALWNRRLVMLTVLSGLLIGVIYVFFISRGLWTVWPEISRDYDSLGAGFRAGDVYLHNEPPLSPALLSLPDPYDPDARNAIPAAKKSADSVWDLALFNGRLYLYWGPVPAVLLALIKLFYSAVIADQYVAFAFLIGLLIFSILVILKLQRKFYPEAPVSLVLICILAIGLVCPLPWMLGTAAIYEATILGGQFFLVGGLYFAISAFEGQSTSLYKPLLAVTFWMLAAGTRTILLVPAVSSTLIILLWSLRNDFDKKQPLKSLPRAILLSLPLAFGVGLYGWYNWARFGSIFETGLRYTVTFLNLNKDIARTFSLNHFFASLWVFLINPFAVQQTFPFLQALPGKFPSVLDFGQVLYYHSENITGVLFCVPFVYFAAVPAWNTLATLSGKIRGKSLSPTDRPREALLWVSLCVGLCTLLTFAALLLYFNLAMRFLADFMPSLMLFSILGVFEGYHALRGKPYRQRIFMTLVFIIATTTITLSLLLAMSQSLTQFQRYNRHLLKEMLQLFGG